MNFDPATIKAGDWLVPDPVWNRTAGRGAELPIPVEVAVAFRSASQTGVVFTVKSTFGHWMELDAGWFTDKVEPPK